MKKIVFLSSVAALLLLASCTKSSSGLAANTAVINYDNTVFNLNTVISDTSDYTVTGDSLFWTVELANSDTSYGMEMLILSTKNSYRTGIFGTLNDDTARLGIFAFIPDMHNLSVGYDAGTGQGKGININVTALSLTTLQGSVSGFVYKNGDTTQVPKAISANFNIHR